uniref:Uncharacterized protein n=1 Tax=Meloidogyne hapla TaxID=6305 RepID=A0A1I8BUS5_MELHA
MEEEISENSSSESATSSSDSSSEENSVEKEEGEFPLENVADWQPPPVCPKGQFRSNGGNCKQCSVCGEDLLLCEWCLNGWNRFENIGDFEIKCVKMLNIRDIFNRKINGMKNQNQQQPTNEGWKKTLAMVFPSESTNLIRIFGINVGISKEVNDWWKIELAVKIGFYLTLISLALAIIRFIYKKKSSSRTYHTVQVKSPPALEEFQEKDIIRAAESIRQKLGKKDYERLQEEFI